MKFLRQSPHPALAEVVKFYWYLQVDESEVPCSEISFPYGAFELIFYKKNPNKMRWLDSGDEFYEPGLFYAGQLTKPYILNFEVSSICTGISLQPWAGNLPFNTPGNYFKDQLVELSDLPGDDSFHEYLNNCATPTAVFQCFEEFIMRRYRASEIDPLSMRLAKTLMYNPCYSTLEAELNDIGLSRRRIEQRFSESVGLNLGTFIKKTRFHHSIKLMERLNVREKLIDISFDLGYYDQSHFIHDFKEFAGITPTNFLNTTSQLKQFLQSVTQRVSEY